MATKRRTRGVDINTNNQPREVSEAQSPPPPPPSKRRKPTTTIDHPTPSSPPPPPTTSTWPTPTATLLSARTLLTNSTPPHPQHTTLLLPDRDVDGLCAGQILHTTLLALGKPPHKIHTHFIPRRRSLWDPVTQDEIVNLIDRIGDVREIVVLDQGTRGERILPVVEEGGGEDGEGKSPKRPKIMIIDHHFPTTGFPPDATHVVSSCSTNPDPNQTSPSPQKQPLPTIPASLLTYILCHPLHPSLPTLLEPLAALGTLADIPHKQITTLWHGEIRDWMEGAIKRAGGVGRCGKVIAMLNAGRRAPEEEEVGSEWDAWEVLGSVCRGAEGGGGGGEGYIPKGGVVAEISRLMDLATQGKGKGKGGKAGTGKTRNENEDENGEAEVLEKIRKLDRAREEAKQEFMRWRSGVAPKFSRDGRLAVLEISSRYQVHPLVATMWAGILGGGRKPKNAPKGGEGGGGQKKKKEEEDGKVKEKEKEKQSLQAVACVNYGYVPGRVNFAVRIVGEGRSGGGEDEEADGGGGGEAGGGAGKVDLIRLLEEYAAKLGPEGRGKLGGDFARGHREATGGSLEEAVWREFRERGLEIVEKERKEGGKSGKVKKGEEEGGGGGDGGEGKGKQKNTLDGFVTRGGRGRRRKAEEVEVVQGG